MQRMINRLNAVHYDRNNPVVTIVNGAEHDAMPPTHRVRIAPNTTSAVLQHRVGPHWLNVPGVAPVTQANMTAFVNFIRNNTYPNHRAALTNSVPWRTFYNVANRVLTYLDQAGAPLAPAPNPETVACYDCGLVLPLHNITVDHQRPQGGNQHEPVAKVFRAMGLTVDAAAGPKGTHFSAAQVPLVGGVAGAGVGTLQAKYTLNDVGKIYYTIADWCGVLADQTMTTACMNHIVNLRPLCNACNTPNRNIRHF
jgi:hypothetical protein